MINDTLFLIGGVERESSFNFVTILLLEYRYIWSSYVEISYLGCFFYFFFKIYISYICFFISRTELRSFIYIYLYFNPVKMDKENDKIDFRF